MQTDSAPLHAAMYAARSVPFSQYSGRPAPKERAPIGAKYAASITRCASSSDSTCGTTMPRTPRSRKRVMVALDGSGMRAIGVRPCRSAVMHMISMSRQSKQPCSPSM